MLGTGLRTIVLSGLLEFLLCKIAVKIMIRLNQLKLIHRDASPNDAEIVISLINNNLATDKRLISYYSSPSVKKWNLSRDKEGDAFLRSHVIVEMEGPGQKLTAGYARYVEWYASGIRCGYIRGPWVSTTVDSRYRVEIGRFAVEKLLEKMYRNGLPLARAQVPLFNVERLTLFKEKLGFSTLDRIFTYSRDPMVLPASTPDLPEDYYFSRYNGAPGEDNDIISLHNTVFPGERLTAESFTALKKEYSGFTGKAAIYLLRKGDQLLGMAWVDFQPTSGNDLPTCWIHDLAVDPLFRQQGLGKALVMECVNKILPSTVKIAASISTFNTASMRTFVSSGFLQEKNSGMELLEKSCESNSR
ncbi:MAG: GNAT family N-acetyltransferase [Candidatus Hodarchaeales archaeon]